MKIWAALPHARKIPTRMINLPDNSKSSAMGAAILTSKLLSFTYFHIEASSEYMLEEGLITNYIIKAPR